MVLELHVPRGADWAALAPLLPVFLAYVLSFIYVGIYWNKHQQANNPQISQRKVQYQTSEQ